jgi:hypothetical protein
MELPGAVYLAAFDGRPEDREYGMGGEDGDVILGRYARSAKAYNEQLRKLGYRKYKDGEGWAEIPEGMPLPKEPLQTEIRRLAEEANSWVLYANRRCRRDFDDVWKVRDGDKRRKLAPDTRSEETAQWQLWDRKHQPTPAEFDIEQVVAEGDVVIAGSGYDEDEPAIDEEAPTLAITPPETGDSDAAVYDEYDFDTHHSLNFRVDAQGKKHLLRLDFSQREAVDGFRKYGRMHEPRSTPRKGGDRRKRMQAGFC